MEYDTTNGNKSDPEMIAFNREALGRDLLTASEQEDGLPYAAWNARNLLELSVRTKYFLASKDNAKRFHDDALRDAHGLLGAHEQLYDMTGKVNTLKDKTRTRLERVPRERLGVALLDSKYEKVINVAKKMGLKRWYDASNTYLSKYAHPTAFLVIGVMHQPTVFVTGLQHCCIAFGVDFANKCMTDLEQMVAAIC